MVAFITLRQNKQGELRTSTNSVLQGGNPRFLCSFLQMRNAILGHNSVTFVVVRES